VASARAEINHPGGMDYTFDDTRLVPWRWQEMVAQLEHESMVYVVNGPDGLSSGLTSCVLSVRPNSYDHKRHHANKQLKKVQPDSPLQVVDFLVTRSDGSALRLHPEWSKSNVEAFDAEGHSTQVAALAKGPGQSDGPGTFKYYKDLGSQGHLKFVASGVPKPTRL